MFSGVKLSIRPFNLFPNLQTPETAMQHFGAKIYKYMNQFGIFSGSFWFVLAPYWFVLVRSGSFWHVLARSGTFWFVLARSGSFSVLQLPLQN